MTRKLTEKTMLWMHGSVVLVFLSVLAAGCQGEPPLEDELATEADVTLADGQLVPTDKKKCNDNDDCKDGDKGTIDWCDSGDCHHSDRDDCEEDGSSCSDSGDCKDGDKDTIDWCYDHECHHAERDSGDCS